VLLCLQFPRISKPVADIKKGGIHVDWTTVTYRSVLMAVLGLVAAGALATFFIFPSFSNSVINKVEEKVNGMLGRTGTGDNTPQGPSTQAHFTNIDGTVSVRRVSNPGVWVKADYGLPLEQGDVVKTDAAGIAKLAFADGSTYLIQQDSLVTIEESTTNAAQQNEVSVRVNTGNIALNTGEIPSTQQVKIDQTSTTLGRDSALQASKHGNNPEVLVTKGEGTFKIGGVTEKVAPFEKVVIDSENQTFAKKKEVAPPVLLAPANMMPIFVTSNARSADLSWTPVEGITTYHVRVSRNPYFSSVEKETKIENTNWKVNGLEEGKYYWQVLSVDENGHESIPSDASVFSIVAKGTEGISLALEVSQLIQHQHVIEIKGNTQQGARVMVNGEQVPVIASDGSFTYFTPPLPSGENVITITAQNEKGGVATQTKKVVIQ
jgi:hypothetical protein